LTTQQLYNDAILAEAKARHGHGRLAKPDVTATCDNPLCGDRVTIDLRLDGDRITELAQTTRGCILTQAAASVIGRHLRGAPAEDLHRAAAEVRRLLAGNDFEPAWSELAMFAPVRAVKSRHECVLLPFDAVAAALAKNEAR
jgi:nitrogen fixation protein NifU and related proteins